MRIAFITCLLLAPRLAQAAIVFQLIPEDRQIFVVGERSFDFDGNGVIDLTFRGESPDFQLLRVQPHALGSILTTRSFSNEAAVLQFGMPVSSTGPYGGTFPEFTPALISQLFDNGNGPVHRGAWAGQSGYLGFNFYHFESESARFGWLEMEEFGGVLRLKSWAYETEDNKFLLAGQIPEPSALLLLAASSSIFWRRRCAVDEK